MADRHIFLSYAREDAAKAKQLAGALESCGLRIWWDRSIPAGRNFDDVIEEALDASSHVIVLWSKASVESKWVRNEVLEADERGLLVPALIEPDVKIPFAFRRVQAADLVGWEGDTSDPRFVAFVSVLKVRLSQAVPVVEEAAPPAPPATTPPKPITAPPAPSPKAEPPVTVTPPPRPKPAAPVSAPPPRAPSESRLPSLRIGGLLAVVVLVVAITVANWPKPPAPTSNSPSTPGGQTPATPTAADPVASSGCSAAYSVAAAQRRVELHASETKDTIWLIGLTGSYDGNGVFVSQGRWCFEKMDDSSWAITQQELWGFPQGTEKVLVGAQRVILSPTRFALRRSGTSWEETHHPMELGPNRVVDSVVFDLGTRTAKFYQKGTLRGTIEKATFSR